MAQIRYGKKGLELDITPISRWYEVENSEPCVEYEIGLYYEDKPLFTDEFAEKTVALKDTQMPHISTFILQVLANGQPDNWIMLSPKVSLFFAPKMAMGCACRGEMPGQTPFCMEIKLDQNLWLEKPDEFSDTGLTLRLEATREQWADFARQLEAEETDF